MGVGPLETAVDDSMYLLFGDRAPYLLRSVFDGDYKYTCKGYVRRIMHREAMRFIDEELTMREFALH
jgi:hypothetical protein